MLEKRFRTVLAALLVFGIPLMGLSGCGEKGDITGSSQQTEGVFIARSVMPLTPTEMDALSPEFVATLNEHQWHRTTNGYERRESLEEFTIVSGGEVVPLESNGTFQVPAASAPKVRYQGYELNTAIAPLTSEMQEGRMVMTLTLSVRQHIEHHGHQHPKTGDASPTVSLPCLDYNGPWGNQRPNQPWPQSAYNFNGSDCWSAWPVCMVRDFTWWPYCNGNRNCSAIIGHCGTYHRHTYPGGPRC